MHGGTMETVKTVADFIQTHEAIIEAIVTIVIFIAAGIYLYFYKPDFFKKIKAGFQSLGTSFSFANKHPMIWYAALFKTFLGVAGIFLLVILERYKVIAISRKSQAAKEAGWSALLILFAIMLAWDYCSQFMNISITHYILGALESRSVTLKEAIGKSFKSAWLLLKFTLLDFLIRLLTGKDEEKKTSRITFINNILSSIVGLAWTAATYFIVPVIAEERVTLRESIRISALTMKNSFGQTIGFETGRSLFLVLPWYITGLLGAGCWLVRAKVKGAHPLLAEGLWITGLGMIIITALLALFAIIATQVTNWIFNCAAYNYTRGKNTGPFDAHFIRDAVITEKEE